MLCNAKSHRFFDYANAPLRMTSDTIASYVILSETIVCYVILSETKWSRRIFFKLALYKYNQFKLVQLDFTHKSCINQIIY